jgi:hypothetical protein
MLHTIRDMSGLIQESAWRPSNPGLVPQQFTEIDHGPLGQGRTPYCLWLERSGEALLHAESYESSACLIE